MRDLAERWLTEWQGGDLREAFPDFRARLEDLIVEGDRAAVRWSATATHRGFYQGLAPTGGIVRFRGLEMLRVEAGRVVEHWGAWDGLDLVRQLTAGRLDLDHVQAAAPPGAEPAARAFYGELLGLAELPKPESLARNGGVWFASGARQIHIGIEQDFRPWKKAHVALRAAGGAALEALAEGLAGRGVPVTWDSRQPGVRRFFTEDPWGNRVELLAEDR